MNRVILQAFSAGIIFSTAIIGGYYYSNHLNDKKEVTIAEAKKMLESQGYFITKSKKEHPMAAKTNQATVISKQTGNNKASNTKETLNKKETISYILKIKNKMTSEDITKELANAKIIDDATAFQNYMNKNGLAVRIQIGEYIVRSDMSYKELGDLITK